MTQNCPILGHFYVILGHFSPKSPKNHEPGYFDLPILAATIFNSPRLVKPTTFKIEKHGFQTNSGADQDGQ
jgi:hypothetical protein